MNKEHLTPPWENTPDEDLELRMKHAMGSYSGKYMLDACKTVAKDYTNRLLTQQKEDKKELLKGFGFFILNKPYHDLAASVEKVVNEFLKTR